MIKKTLEDLPSSLPGWHELIHRHDLSLQIGEWQVEPSRNLLIGGGLPKKVGRKVMELLIFLTSHAGRVIEKQEIVREVWENRFVSDMVVTVTVSHLRRALGDNAKAPEYLKTINGIGYKFLKRPVLQQVPDQPCEIGTPKEIANEIGTPKKFVSRAAAFGKLWLLLPMMILAGGLVREQPQFDRPSLAATTGPRGGTLEWVRILNLTEGEAGDFFTSILAQEVKGAVEKVIRNPVTADRFCAEVLFVEGALLAFEPEWQWRVKIFDASNGRTLWLCQASAPPSEFGSHLVGNWSLSQVKR